MDRLDLEVGWEVDNNQLKASMADSKKAIEGVGQSVDVVEKKVNDNLNTITKQANQTRGSFNGLQNSINQISRELPAFTYSAQTGFMAISNNLPILFDSIGQLRKENEALIASGQKGVPIWKQLGSAFLGWGTILSVGITLLTVYGKEIGNWIKGLVGAKSSVDALKASEESLNDVRKNSNKTYAESVSKIETYLSIARNEKNSMDQRQDAVRKIIALDRERLKGITLETIKTGEATKAINAYTEALKRQAMEKAVVDKRAELTTKLLDAQTESEDALRIAADARVKQLNQKFKFDPDEETATDARAKKKIDEYVKSVDKVKEAQKAIDEFDKRASKFLGSVDVVDNSPNSSVKDKSYFQRVIDVAQEELNGLDKQSKDFPKKAAALKASIKNAQKELEAFSVPNDSSINKAATLYEQILESRGDALGKILDMEREYSSMLLSDDEKEKAALKQKFVDLRKIIDDANKDIQKYNKENGAKFKLIDVGLVAPIEATAGEQLDYAQTTARIQKQFAEEYKVFQAYEELKASTSVEYADKRFADQLEKIKSFESRLASELAGIGTEGLNALEQKRADDLGKIQSGIADKRQADEDKRYADMLKAYLSFAQKREKVIKESEEEITRLTADGRKEQAEEARKARDKELEELTRTEISDNDAFKDLEKNLDKMGFNMSLKAVKIGRQTVEKLIDGSKMTPDQKAKLAKEFDVYFDGLESGLEENNLDKVMSLTSEFGSLVSLAGQFDGTMSNAFKTVGGMVSQVGNIAKMLSNVGSGMSKAGGVAGIIGAVISIFGGIMEAIEGSYNRQKQKQKEADDFQIKQLDAQTKILEYQLSIIQEMYGTKRLEAYTQAIKDATDAANNSIAGLPVGSYALQTGDKGNDQLLGKFNKDFGTIEKLDEAIAKARKEADKFGNKLGSFFLGGWVKNWKAELSILEDLKKRVLSTDSIEFGWKSVSDITQEEITKMEKLLLESKFDDVTAAKIRNIIDQFYLLKDAMNQAREELTGTSFSSLLNDVKSLFSNSGEDSAEAWAKGFDKIMDTYIMQRFSREYLEEALQGWYELFDQYAKDGIDSGERKALQDAFNKIKEDGDKRIKDIQDAMGHTPTSDSSSSGGITGRINRTVSEDTASAILGFERSRYDLAKQRTVLSQKALEIWQGSRDLFVQMVKHQAAIEQNTYETAVQLKLAVDELKAIKSNTGVKVGR
ncbi:hypothetical protein [Sphingobacterium luzhongxinii]|uniref:hypothetical protein n=1 Tax=Sphingobacterium luzhongxinii TaxID=2654181 RepID=UPI0013DC0F36|nr:hypothetical protein [Sphingobacterium sp. xlx-73]